MGTSRENAKPLLYSRAKSGIRILIPLHGSRRTTRGGGEQLRGSCCRARGAQGVARNEKKRKIAVAINAEDSIEGGRHLLISKGARKNLASSPGDPRGGRRRREKAEDG